jgi:hypothetical protein
LEEMTVSDFFRFLKITAHNLKSWNLQS